MEMAARGEIPLDEASGAHIDTCLECVACVTACPSGVQYDKLIEAVRPQFERNVGRGALDRLFRFLIFSVFPYPTRLRLAALFGALYQRLGLRALSIYAGYEDDGLARVGGPSTCSRPRKSTSSSPTSPAAARR